MELSESQTARLRSIARAVLTTVDGDGVPRSVLVNSFVRANRREVGVFSARESRKIAHLLHHPKLALCFVDGIRYCALTGDVRIEEDPDCLASAVFDFTRTYGRAPRARNDRVLITLAIAGVVDHLGD
ncbi:MAG: pyridoxamine 5'-phosphate oxidase family protein [Ferrimicrobium sp.]